MAKQKEKLKVTLEWAYQPRQVEFLKACGLDFLFAGRGIVAEPPKARIVLYGGSAGGGKLLEINTSIPTPTGYRKLEHIHAGDTVFGRDGKTHTVLFESDLITADAWELVFDDDSTVVAHDDHKWLTYDSNELGALTRLNDEWRAARRGRRKSVAGNNKSTLFRETITQRNREGIGENTKEPPAGSIRTTKEIVDTLYVGTRKNHAIPVAEALELPHQTLPLDPYLLGCFLGDGHRGTGRLTTMDQEIVDTFAAQFPVAHIDIGKGKASGYRFMGLRPILKDMGVLENKNIPPGYLWASKEQRLELLKGLMDTDGGVCANKVEFCNTNENIATGVAHLVRSLGMKARITTQNPKCNGVECKMAYRVVWTPNIIVFNLPRKAEKQNITTRQTTKFRYIKEANKVENVTMKCLRVSSSDHLFLATENMIPTHNTDGLLIVGYSACIAFPGCNVGYFRRRYPDLEGLGGAIPRSKQLYTDVAKYHGQQRRWKFPGGSHLQFCHCQNEDDIYNYHSQQFDILLIDESTQFSEFQLRYLLTRNRATVNHLIPFCAMATNPGGASHVYHLEKFIEAGPPGEPVDVEVQPGLFEKHIFIPAKLSDNMMLEERDPGYRSMLERMPEDVRRALLDGDWYVFQGQYFREFKREKHIIEPFKIPPTWRRFASIDWGYKAPCAVLWHAIDPDTNRIYTYRELYVTEKRAGEVAELFLNRSQGEKIPYIKMSPDAWQERGLGSKALPGEVIAEEFLKLQINVEPADNRRVLGWQRVREYLSDDDSGVPHWQVFNTCHHLIRTLPALIHDRNKVEDVSQDCEDHACESLRYGLMSRPSPMDHEFFLPGIDHLNQDPDVANEEDDELADMLDGEDSDVSFFGM